MHWKPNSWILIGVLLAAALTATGVAQVGTTQVADTIYHADGTAATGTAIISWPAFTTGAGDAIPSGSVSATIAAGGALSVQLVPNAGATPIGSYYTVVYHLDDGTVSRQYWVVPASAAAVKVSAIESTVLPISVAMQTVSKSYVDTAIAAAVTGHPLDSTTYVLKAGDTMAGPLLLPADPVSAAQAADKHYVDASVAALSGGQNAATPPQTQYAVPAYLLSPSGGLASPGASHLSVDPTGYNLSGYHTNFTNLGVNAAQADCTQVGGLFGGHSCSALTAYYSSDTGNIEWGNVINYNAYGVGQNLGNDGHGREGNPFGIVDNYRVRGANAANVIAMFGSRVGDWGPWYDYDYSDGGAQAPSDEGLTVAGTYQGGESFGYWHGTILTGGTGVTLPTFNFTGGCGSFNACTPTDGGILLDTQTAIASGYLTGPSVNVSTGAVPLKALPVSTTLPTTTAWGHAEGISIPAQQERLPAVAATITLTMVTGSFSPGDHVCVEGTATAGGFDEQSTVTSVSGSTITLPLAYPYTNIAIFKGGPCGTYISFSADLALNGYRTSYHAIASFTGSDLIYAVPSGGGLNWSIGAGLPQAGAEPETTGGSSDPNAAFQTFCGAEIDAALAPNDDTVQIDPNVCSWTIGDTVESPHFPAQKVNGMFMLVNQNMPNSSGLGTGGINLQMSGMGVANYTQGYNINNNNSASWYTNSGGKLTPPQCAFCSFGTWNDTLLTTAPANSIIEVQAHLPGQTSYDIFKDGGGGFGGTIKLDASGFTFSDSLNTAGGFNGSGLSVTGPVSAESSGSTAIMTVIDGALLPGTPSFTQAGQNGSLAVFGMANSYPTVNPLLGLFTGYNATPSTYQSGLQAYNGSGTAVPFLSVQSGPSVSDTNLTLENGNTHCATLICLGPGASVDSSGDVAAATLALAGCASGTYAKADGTGCGSPGGGGGGVPLLSSNATTTVTITPTTGSDVYFTGASSGELHLGTTGHTDQILLDQYGMSHFGNLSGYASTFDQYGGLNTTNTPYAALMHSIDMTAGYVYQWNGDTGLSRDSAGTVDVGNGTAGDSSGTVKASGGFVGPLSSAEVVSFSSAPTFSTNYNTSRIVLTGSIASFTLGAGADGQNKTLCFKQGSGAYTVTPPANVHGFFTIGVTNGDWNCQSFNYDNTDSIWLATAAGVVNQ